MAPFVGGNAQMFDLLPNTFLGPEVLGQAIGTACWSLAAGSNHRLRGKFYVSCAGGCVERWWIPFWLLKKAQGGKSIFAHFLRLELSLLVVCGWISKDAASRSSSQAGFEYASEARTALLLATCGSSTRRAWSTRTLRIAQIDSSIHSSIPSELLQHSFRAIAVLIRHEAMSTIAQQRRPREDLRHPFESPLVLESIPKACLKGRVKTKIRSINFIPCRLRRLASERVHD